MKEGIPVTGFVLSVMPINEYDRRIVLLTKEKGKISVFCKGARRPSSSFVASTQTFTFGTFMLFAGKNAYNLMSVEVKNYFSELRDDYQKVYRGMYFCEFVEYFAQEGQDETALLSLLYQSLRALGKERLDAKLIRAIFDLRLITIEGEGPLVNQCLCHRMDGSIGKDLPDKLLFSIKRASLLCPDCEDKDPDAQTILRGTFFALQYICHAPLEKLYHFSLAEENIVELCRLVKQYIHHYVPKKMKSEELY